MKQEIEELLRCCPQLPTLSGVALRIVKMARDPEINIDQFAALISKAPALTARIMRAANSPLLRQARPGGVGAPRLERIRKHVETAEYELATGHFLGLILSVGTAAHMDGTRIRGKPEDLIRAADEALYLAKQHGRNRVEISE